MSADPFPGRCRRCGLGLLEADADDCGRGPDECRSGLDRLRDLTAAICRKGRAVALWLGLPRW